MPQGLILILSGAVTDGTLEHSKCLRYYHDLEDVSEALCANSSCSMATTFRNR